MRVRQDDVGGALGSTSGSAAIMANRISFCMGEEPSERLVLGASALVVEMCTYDGWMIGFVL